MANEIQKTWAAIENARIRSAKPNCRIPMRPPATPDALEQRLARSIGTAIPSQLRESLLIHNGIATRRGAWFDDLYGSIYPLSVGEIESRWHADRRHERQLEKEGDTWWVLKRNLIPVIGDLAAHHTFYVDANDGRFCFYVEDGGYLHDHRFPSYTTFLKHVLSCIESDEAFEWPSPKR